VDIYFTAAGMIDIPTRRNPCYDERDKGKTAGIPLYSIKWENGVSPFLGLHRTLHKLLPYNVVAQWIF
jgi:hypothetical protein